MQISEELQISLPITGERFIPGQAGNIAVEHTHRYMVAREYVHGKKVLDIASGEGYGSHCLSEVAESVIGVDIAEDAVLYANRRYQKQGLEYRVGSCANIPLEDASVDVVVSFETIEHHDEHEAMMAEIKRVLRPGGLLIISSPDKHEYSDVTGNANHFHVKELYREEFERLLNSCFARVQLMGQRVVIGSAISSMAQHHSSDYVSYLGNVQDVQKCHGVVRPTYFIALASDGPLPEVSHSFFMDRVEWRRTSQIEMMLEMEINKLYQDAEKVALARICASKSWRLTAPLRKMCEMLRRIKNVLILPK